MRAALSLVFENKKQQGDVLLSQTIVEARIQLPLGLRHNAGKMIDRYGTTFSTTRSTTFSRNAHLWLNRLKLQAGRQGTNRIPNAPSCTT